MSDSPWLTLKAAADYAGGDADGRPALSDPAENKPRRRRSHRFLAREIAAGRLRAARVGGRGEFVLRREWIDAWLEDLARPVAAQVRRRA
jgi:hypothetical protein